MKKIVLIIVVCLFSTTGFCQNSNRVKVAKGFVWFGLDFTQTKFRGVESSFPDFSTIKNTYFDQWNLLILQEKEKYNLKEAFEKGIVDVKISTAIEQNKTKEMSDVLSLDPVYIKKESLKNIVSNYSAQSDESIGLIFIVESLDKIDLEVSVWVTFFDINTKEILFAKNVRGKAQGFGFRNYWAGGIYRIIKQCDANFDTWLSEEN